MKYSININQLVLAKYKNLDVADGAILDFLGHLCGSAHPAVVKKRIVEKDKTWTWVNLAHLIQEMPLLRVSATSSVSRRLTKIEKEGFLTTKRKIHQKLYVALTPKYDELLRLSNSQQGAIASTQQSYCVKATDNNIIDNKERKSLKTLPKENRKKSVNTNVTSAMRSPELIPPSPIVKESRTREAKLLKHFQTVTKQPRVRMTDGRKLKLKVRLQEFSFDEIMSAITNASQDYWWMGPGKRYLTIDYLLRNNETLDRLLNLKPNKNVKSKSKRFFKRVQ